MYILDTLQPSLACVPSVPVHWDGYNSREAELKSIFQPVLMSENQSNTLLQELTH